MRLRTTRLAAGALALVMVFGFLASGSAWAKPQKVTTVEGITEYRYDNGLRLLIFPDPSKPTVTVNITYLVGSRHEGRGEAGMAHLLEHMMFKGTEQHHDPWRELEDHGASFNGTTWVDRTNYYETLPTSEPGNLEWALALEADRMINSRIAQEDLDSEFSVVRNEFEMNENNPVSILSERMMSSAYLWHNYGKSTIGSKSDIERVPVTNLRAFYRKYYQPDNAMLVIAGDFQEKDALELVDKYFAAIPRPDRHLDETYTVEPVQDGARHVELRRVGEVAACGAVFHICSGSHADFAAIDVLDTMLSDEPSGRLYKALVESGMAATLSTNAYPWKEPGVLECLATVRLDQRIEPVLEEMKKVVERFATSEITEDEVNRAKNRILKQIDLSLKNSERIAVGLTNWAGAGDWRLFFLHRDRVERVTVDDVRRVARQYLKPSNRTTGIFHPTREPDRTEVPETPNVAALVKHYKGRDALSQGEEFEATPENIERRVRRSQLSNGLKLALLPKETRGDAVRAVLTLHFGSETDLKGRTEGASLVPEMLMRGTKKRTYEELRDELDRLKARIDFRGGGMLGDTLGSVDCSIETDRANLPAVIELAGEILKEPAFPEKEFEIVKRERLAALEEQLSDPMALAFNSVLRRLNPWPSDDVRYVPTVAESIARLDAVQLDDVRSVHRELYGAGDAEMTVVGDFGEAETKTAISKTFGEWRAQKPFERIKSICHTDVQGSEDVIDTPDKKMAMVGAAINVAMRDDDPEYPALNLANYVFGASAKSRLLTRLRHKGGLSYGAGSIFAADSQDRDAMLFALAICAPQNADKAMVGMLDEYKRLVEEGIPSDELKEAQESYALRVRNQLANDASVARILNSGLHVGRTMEYHKDLLEKVARLTPDDIRSVVRKYIRPDQLVKAKAGDLKSTEPEN